MDVCHMLIANKKQKKMNKKMNHLGIDVGKRKCRAALKIIEERMDSSLVTILMEY
jgi:hypothetical protein